MFCPLARLIPTVPLRLAKLPPDTVMSYWPTLPLTSETFVIVAVVPVMLKSDASTLAIASLNVARNTSVSTLVELLTGFCRVKLAKRGTPVSTIKVVTWSVPPFSLLPAWSANDPAPLSVTVYSPNTDRVGNTSDSLFVPVPRLLCGMTTAPFGASTAMSVFAQIVRSLKMKSNTGDASDVIRSVALTPVSSTNVIEETVGPELSACTVSSATLALTRP